MTDMTIDVAQARRDTPGTERLAHLNNAGAALPTRHVTEAMIAQLRREASSGGYEAAAAASAQVQRCYPAVAELLSCDAREVAIVENATRAWDMAFYAQRLRPGDRILTGRAEYASNAIAMLQVAARSGARVKVIEDDEHGQLDVAALVAASDDDVKLVALTHVPTQSGLVNPAAAVGRLTRAAGVTFLLDACQSAGQMPLDVGELGCDLLSATGRKFLRGPRGIGFLYVAERLIPDLEPPFLDLHSAEWTGPGRYRIRSDGPALRELGGEHRCQDRARGGGGPGTGLGAGRDRTAGQRAGRRTARAVARTARRAGARSGRAALRHRHVHRGRDPGTAGGREVAAGAGEHECVLRRVLPLGPAAPWAGGGGARIGALLQQR
jgi:selenocysteine lyase/cysteine desulfurase